MMHAGPIMQVCVSTNANAAKCPTISEVCAVRFGTTGNSVSVEWFTG